MSREDEYWGLLCLAEEQRDKAEARVKEQAETIKRLQEAYLPGNWEKLEAYKRVVDAAKSFVACRYEEQSQSFIYWRHELMDRLREMDGEKQSTTCECGHNKTAHIYEEGACRPEFQCENKCDHFVAKKN